MRIASLLPGATDAVLALGAREALVGVSHECDQPAVATLPRLTRSRIDPSQPSAAIDDAVRTALAAGQPLYDIDQDALRRAAPEIVITQQLCPVCAPDLTLVAPALESLARPPHVLSLHPHTLEGVLTDLRALGEAIGLAEQGRATEAALRERLARVAALVDGTRRPRVFCLEWLSPPMACGHWVPEQVAAAGGEEVLAKAGEPSRRVSWERVAAQDPEIVIAMPCGFSIERTRTEMATLARDPGWNSLRAVRLGRVFLVDGPQYFNRPGPKLVDGVEILATIFHPERVGELVPCTGFQAW